VVIGASPSPDGFGGQVGGQAFCGRTVSNLP
jgi:hypothetical protein